VADPKLEANLAWWDERVPIHMSSELYDLRGFRAGRSNLAAYELDELGPVAGLELLHLQCHVGLDTLSWARLGARVTGYDFSPPALEAARGLAAELRLSAEFVLGELTEAPERLGRRFDVVYTGKGALTWLPNLRRWAEAVVRLLRPGGRLYLVEFHPIADIMEDGSTAFEGDYLPGAELVFDEPGDYADLQVATQHNRSHLWVHPLGEVVTELARRGLRVELLRERCETYYPRFPPPYLEQMGEGLWAAPADAPKIPLVYSLLARAPATT
jgi:SAM-dependent methyltransferase